MLDSCAKCFTNLFETNQRAEIVKKLFQVCAIASLTSVLAACGGGGDGPSPAGPLTALAGTWVGDCGPAGVRDKVIITVNSGGTAMEIKNEIDYFAAADCSGSPGATLYHRNATVNATTKGQADVNTPAPNSQIVKAESAEVVVTSGSPNILSKGLNVSWTMQSRDLVWQKEWCVYGVAGNQNPYCFDDKEVTLASGTTSAAFYINGTTLYTFEDDDGNGQFGSSGTFRRLP